jgi:hypothetical protein
MGYGLLPRLDMLKSLGLVWIPGATDNASPRRRLAQSWQQRHANDGNVSKVIALKPSLLFRQHERDLPGTQGGPAVATRLATAKSGRSFLVTWEGR